MSIAEHVTGLQHLGLPTAALDETAAFYESLGFVRAHSTVNPGTGERVCFLTDWSVRRYLTHFFVQN